MQEREASKQEEGFAIKCQQNKSKGIVVVSSNYQAISLSQTIESTTYTNELDQKDNALL